MPFNKSVVVKRSKLFYVKKVFFEKLGSVEFKLFGCIECIEWCEGGGRKEVMGTRLRYTKGDVKGFCEFDGE